MIMRSNISRGKIQQEDKIIGEFSVWETNQMISFSISGHNCPPFIVFETTWTEDIFWVRGYRGEEIDELCFNERWTIGGKNGNT